MTQEAFAARLDATNLKLDATAHDLHRLCDDAARAGYASVCVYPASVSLCVRALSGTGVAVCAVAGFPHGRSGLETKTAEIRQITADGGSEVDFVMNYPALIAGEHNRVADETAGLCAVAHEAGAVCKVIVETCYLDAPLKAEALRICEAAGADFIKTSTGFGATGAAAEDVRLFRDARTGSIRIKASGGIRDIGQARRLIEAGADRLGVSAARTLLDAWGRGPAT